MLKIKELTQKHIISKQQAAGEVPDVVMDLSEGGEDADEASGDEESKTAKAGNKESKYKNKGLISEEKSKNKRQDKEARKKIKQKKKQGIMGK